MPRAVKDAKLDTRTARARLKPSPKPYYRAIDHGLHLGYRKGERAGRWVARFYLGGQQYEVVTIGTADDQSEADGIVVLDWRQAQDAARKRAAQRAKAAAGVVEESPLTIAAACQDYVKICAPGRASGPPGRPMAGCASICCLCLARSCSPR